MRSEHLHSRRRRRHWPASPRRRLARSGNRGVRISLAVIGTFAALALLAAACSGAPASQSTPSSAGSSPSQVPTRSSVDHTPTRPVPTRSTVDHTPPPTPTVTATTGLTAGSASPPNRSGCAYPTPSCAGVPAGTSFVQNVGTYTASSPGQQIDRWHIAGDLVIAASNVVVENSQIDGTVINEVGPTHYGPFTVTDTTIGPANGCIGQPGLGESSY